MKTIIIIALLIGVSCLTDYNSESQLKYNWSTGNYEYAKPDEQMKYNWSTNSYSYEKPDAQLKYNWSTNKYEYVD